MQPSAVDLLELLQRCSLVGPIRSASRRRPKRRRGNRRSVSLRISCGSVTSDRNGAVGRELSRRRQATDGKSSGQVSGCVRGRVPGRANRRARRRCAGAGLCDARALPITGRWDIHDGPIRLGGTGGHGCA
jgi:hypothetical protein